MTSPARINSRPLLLETPGIPLVKGQFPAVRPRRTRRTEVLRRLVCETRLSIEQLIMPLFVRAGRGVRAEIASMPGNYHYSPDTLAEACAEIADLGLPGVLLFGVPDEKDPEGAGAYLPDGIIQEAVRAIKARVPGLLVITDVCLCEYTSHGHCGLIIDGDVDNDATLELLARTALSQVEAGADLVAPSDMMDGRVGAIRAALDDAGHATVPILAYAAKYASAFYGPFRDAAGSAPQFGDRRSYQMDPANSDEALREVALDIAEGADIVMVKPALSYLDVLYRVKHELGYPTAAYHTSGEFAMLEAAGARGWIDRDRAVWEATLAIRRAGADMILTYYAKELAHWLDEGSAQL